ncbi:MAG: hypothetical protein RJP98_07385 [Phycisphaerales bacterium]|jgi:adenylate cyclase
MTPVRPENPSPPEPGQPNEAAVREHVERVLSAPEFSHSHRMQAFLRFVVEETLAGRGEMLKAYTIGVSVYRKDAGFDPSTDPIVRVDARRLRRKLQAHYADAGAGDKLRIDVPKGQYAPRFKWVKRDPTELQIDSKASDRPVVLVLPFENLSDDHEQLFFCEGLTDEIINELSRFPDVEVLGRQTSFRLSDERRDLRLVSGEVGARFVLSGTVRRGPERFRINTSLVDGTDGKQVWAESYTRDVTAQDLIEIQDEITRSVAAKVAEPYGVIPRLLTEDAHQRRSESLTAYEWVLRFYRYWAEPLPDRYHALRDNLPTAIELDPANASIRAAYSLLSADAVRFFRDATKSRGEWLGGAVESARRAVEIDSESAFTFQALATALFHSKDMAGFERAAAQAVRLCPNHANLLADLAVLKMCLGEWDEASSMTSRAIDLNPHHPAWYRVVPCLCALIEGDLDSALYHARSQITPGLTLTRVNAAIVYDAVGDNSRAKEELKRAADEQQGALGSFLLEATDIWNMHPRIAERYRSLAAQA